MPAVRCPPGPRGQSRGVGVAVPRATPRGRSHPASGYSARSGRVRRATFTPSGSACSAFRRIGCMPRGIFSRSDRSAPTRPTNSSRASWAIAISWCWPRSRAASRRARTSATAGRRSRHCRTKKRPDGYLGPPSTFIIRH